VARASEAVKESRKELKHFTPRRRGAKESKQLFFAIFASLRETVYLFTTDHALVLPTGMKTGDSVSRTSLTLFFSETNDIVVGRIYFRVSFSCP
jgi:hypothetical protein